MDDYQKLVVLGEVAKDEELPFVSKWRALPLEQKLKRLSFFEVAFFYQQRIQNSKASMLIAQRRFV